MDDQKASSEEFLTIEEFAVLLRIHPQTVRRSIKKGRIHAFRIGIGIRSGFRIPRSELSRMAILDLENFIEKIIEERLHDGNKISPK